MRIFGTWILLYTLLFLTECAPKPPSVPVDRAIGSVEHDLVAAHSLAIANYVTWTPQQKTAFAYSVLKEQCRQGTPDPILAIMSGTDTMVLTGSFTRDGGLSIGSVTTAPSIGLSGSVSKSVGQSISVPVSFVSLSTIPSMEQELEVTRAGNLLGQNDGNRGAVAKRIIDERTAYVVYVQTLIDRYTPLMCDLRPDHPVVYIGTKAGR